jgi:hypothetical protein
VRFESNGLGIASMDHTVVEVQAFIDEENRLLENRSTKAESTTPKDPSRRVRCDSFRCTHESIENVISCARSYRTLRDGSFKDALPGTSCQATIGLSLRDRLADGSQRLLGSA